jgi:hypothetical protein
MSRVCSHGYRPIVRTHGKRAVIVIIVIISLVVVVVV